MFLKVCLCRCWGPFSADVPRQAGLSSVAPELYCSLRQPLQSEQKKGKGGSSLNQYFRNQKQPCAEQTQIVLLVSP